MIEEQEHRGEIAFVWKLTSFRLSSVRLVSAVLLVTVKNHPMHTITPTPILLQQQKRTASAAESATIDGAYRIAGVFRKQGEAWHPVLREYCRPQRAAYFKTCQ